LKNNEKIMKRKDIESQFKENTRKFHQFMDDKIQELYRTGNVHKYHFLDVPEDIKPHLVKPDFIKGRAPIWNDEIMKELGVSCILRYGGRWFLLRGTIAKVVDGKIVKTKLYADET